MHNLLRVVLASSLLCLSIDLKPSFSENVNIPNFSTNLETALNSYDPKNLQDLIADDNKSDIQTNYERFNKRFSNLNWSRAFEADEYQKIFQVGHDKMEKYVSALQVAGNE